MAQLMFKLIACHRSPQPLLLSIAMMVVSHELLDLPEA